MLLIANASFNKVELTEMSSILHIGQHQPDLHPLCVYMIEQPAAWPGCTFLWKLAPDTSLSTSVNACAASSDMSGARFGHCCAEVWRREEMTFAMPTHASNSVGPSGRPTPPGAPMSRRTVSFIPLSTVPAR